MNVEIGAHAGNHPSGDIAAHPIEPRCDALAALLRLAGTSPQRCRGLPARRIAARSGAPN